MSHTHRHPKSRNQWFRLDVPARLQKLVGKTSWKQSLHTADKDIAAIKRAELTSFFRAEILRLDGQLVRAETEEGRTLVDRALEVWTARNGSLDAVVRAILTFMTLRVRQSWGPHHKREAGWDFGLHFYPADDEDDTAEDQHAALPGFDTDLDREEFVTRQRLLERRGFADGITTQEVALRLLSRQAWSDVEVDLLGLLQVVGVELKPRTPKFDAAAEHLLRRLAEHEFSDWQKNVRRALVPAASAISQARVTSASSQASSPQLPPLALDGRDGHPLSEVLHAWQNYSKAGLKSKDEFGSAVQRFIAVFGDLPVENITKRMVTDWKNLLIRLPPKPKGLLAKLSLSELANYADAHDLKRISSETVTKHVQAMRSVLRHARDELLILDAALATDGVTVESSDDDRVEVLPFAEDQLSHIFSQPMMINADEGDDTVFWFLLLAPFTGCRIEETAQLRPSNVRAEKQVYFIAIERDRIARRRQISEEGGIQKRLKTRRTSKRNIPVHSILQEAGFLEFTSIMAERNADWLFDNLREYERYDQRGKYMSNKIMRHLRKIGIADRENVYHSFRHSLKRELRDDEQTKEEISDLLTGHSFGESVGRKYARGAGLQTLAAAVNRINYSTVDWDKVVATGRARVARLRSNG